MRHALFALALLAAVPARAAVIFSDSFESPVAGSGNAVDGASPGWSFINQGGFTGVYDQGTTGRLQYVPDGAQFAYIGRGSSGGGELIRDSGVSVSAGSTYNFQSYVGADSASANQGLWQLELWSGRPTASGSVLLGTTNAASAGAAIPPAKGWVLNTVSYSASANAGELWVALNVLAPPAASSGFNDAVYDVASLQVSAAAAQPVPAPGGVGLLVVGLLAAGFARRQLGADA